jgi:hypothetical protein
VRPRLRAERSPAAMPILTVIVIRLPLMEQKC